MNSTFGFKWDAARNACAAAGSGGDLIMLDEQGEDLYLYEEYWSLWSEESWLGAKYGNGV